MVISEFQMITGIYPTAKLYEAIDKAYMDSKLDKHEFCQRYMENRDGMAMRIAYEETLKESQAEIELSRSEADKRKALEVWIARLNFWRRIWNRRKNGGRMRTKQTSGRRTMKR